MIQQSTCRRRQNVRHTWLSVPNVRPIMKNWPKRLMPYNHRRHLPNHLSADQSASSTISGAPSLPPQCSSWDSLSVGATFSPHPLWPRLHAANSLSSGLKVCRMWAVSKWQSMPAQRPMKTLLISTQKPTS